MQLQFGNNCILAEKRRILLNCIFAENRKNLLFRNLAENRKFFLNCNLAENRKNPLFCNLAENLPLKRGIKIPPFKGCEVFASAKLKCVKTSKTF